MRSIEVIPVEGMGEISPGDDLAALVARAAPPLQTGDVVVIAQKVVSKSEGRIVPHAEKAAAIASESSHVLRRLGQMVIAQTRHGLVCANAGVDSSNVDGDAVLLLPIDPDLSARRLRKRLGVLAGADVAVVISDTFGRAWRLGQTNVAIGVAGMDPFHDYRGMRDAHGRDLYATRICTADELAGAAELVMGKTRGICAALVRGADVVRGPGAAADIVRPPAQDLFR